MRSATAQRTVHEHDHRQHRTHEHRLGAGVGAVVHPRQGRVVSRRVQVHHPDRRGNGAEERDRAHDQVRAGNAEAPPAQQQHAEHDRRPEQVELLLDRERPEMQHRRRAGERREVRLARPMKCQFTTYPSDASTSPRSVSSPREGASTAAYTSTASEHHEQGRQQASRASGPERTERDAARPIPLAEQEPRDQESRQREERVQRRARRPP